MMQSHIPSNYMSFADSSYENFFQVPGIIEDQDGLVSCACFNSHTKYGLKKCGFLIAIVTTLLYVSLFLPYIVAMAKSAMPAILPFVSQAGGSPPMNGLFAIALIILAFIGVITFPLIYETINHRNIKDDKRIRILNKYSAVIICLCILGCIITAAFPVGYTQVPNKFEWIVTVLFEHGIGASLILIGAAIYQFLCTRVWFLLPDASKIAKYFKLMLSIGFLILFCISVKPMPDHLVEELGPEPFNIEMLKNTTYNLPLVFSTSYLICSFCEWAACILITLNFISFYKDLQRVSLRVVLRHKSCFMDSADTSSHIFLKSLS